MGLQRSQEDVTIKEMARWEHCDVNSPMNGTFIQAVPWRADGTGGKKDMPFMEYPKMLYRAETAFGGPRISGYNVVKSEGEQLLAEGQGWCLTQEEALADVGRRDLELATLAANRAHNDRWMSDKAKAEVAVVDESTMQHLPEIPATPIRKAGAKS